MSELLKVERLDVHYGGIQAVRDVSFTLHEGEQATLIGANGAGKSSTVRAITGLEPFSGEILFNGKAVRRRKAESLLREGLVMVPEGRGIFGKLTVEENLLMGLSRFGASEAKTVPEFIYELFPVLREMKHRRGGDLSGGQQQQLAIGRALASQPRLLILDEPTEGIQPSVIKEIGVVIRKLAERGDMAILLVEQFYDFAAELADQYLVMSRGEIVQQGRGETMEADGVRGLVAI